MKQSTKKSKFSTSKIIQKELTKEQLLTIKGGNSNESPPPPPVPPSDPIIGTTDIVDF